MSSSLGHVDHKGSELINQDYIYSLLTGYVDPPPGVAVAEGMNYNPYVIASILIAHTADRQLLPRRWYRHGSCPL